MIRKIFIPLLLINLFFLSIPVLIFSDETPLKNHDNPRTKTDLSPSYTVPSSEQTHAGPMIHSVKIKSNNIVLSYVNKYSSAEGLMWIKKALSRGEVYRDFIASRIQYYNLPPELLYLPVIESEFNIYAVSKSGATGLWQFMKNSIGPYNMKINQWLDERRDFRKSTEGSLRKLKYNYEQTGDWLLALAAYNCGLGRIQRIIKKSGITDFWLLSEKGYLPEETRHYVPKFLAVAHICSYSGRNMLPVSWEQAGLWDAIELDQSVDLGILAKESGIPIPLLKQGNAELRYGITPPAAESYFLKVPQEYSDAIKYTLNNRKNRLIRFYVHRVYSGDTFYDLSRHFGVPVAMIQKYNSGINPRTLSVGSTLTIPALKEVGPYEHNTKHSSLQTAKKNTAIKNYSGIYTVQKGDTLWSIAKKNNISSEELARNNGLSITGILQAGIRLQVPKQIDALEKKSNYGM